MDKYTLEVAGFFFFRLVLIYAVVQGEPLNSGLPTTEHSMVSAPRGKLPVGGGLWAELRERKKVDVCVDSKGVKGQRPKEGRTTATGTDGAGGARGGQGQTSRVASVTGVRGRLPRFP